jgi:hypothetical protein
LQNDSSLSDGSGCQAAFIECLQRDRGPTQLNSCNIDCHVLAAALKGNSRVTRLRLYTDLRHTDDAGKGVIFRSLAENKGLVKLDLVSSSISDENWTILCQSLKGHPTLTSLDLRYTNPRALNVQQKSLRTRVAAEMMEENRVLLTIRLSEQDRGDQINMKMIHPYLEINLYRPRVLGIKKSDTALRRALLGRALQTESGRFKSNLLWMFLLENQDVVVRSIE